jgi:hypothetical protein
MNFETPNQLSHPDLNPETNDYIHSTFQEVKLLKLQLDQAQTIDEKIQIAEKLKIKLELIQKSKEAGKPIQEGESDLIRQIEQAQEIMGQEFFLGPDDIEQTFGFKLEAKDIPEISFSKEEIEQHQKLGDMLVLNLDKTPEGLPLTIEEMAQRAMQNIGSNVIGTDKYLLYKDQFDEQGKLKSGAWFSGEAEIKKQTPRLGWQFVSPNILPNSTSKDYLNQTELLIQNAKEKLFNNNFPLEYQVAEAEFQQEKARISEFIKNNNYVEASKILSNLKISKLLREPIQNTIFRYLVSFKKGKQLFTDGKYSWSDDVSSDGGLLRFGYAGASGADVYRNDPGHSNDSLGVVSSRF